MRQGHHSVHLTQHEIVMLSMQMVADTGLRLPVSEQFLNSTSAHTLSCLVQAPQLMPSANDSNISKTGLILRVPRPDWCIKSSAFQSYFCNTIQLEP